MQSLEEVKQHFEAALKQSLHAILEKDLIASIDAAVAKSETKLDDLLVGAIKAEAVASIKAKIDGIKL